MRVVDFDVPEELRDWLAELRAFGREELRPAEEQLDRTPDPATAYTSDAYRAIRARGSALGLNRLLLPRAIGGPDLPPIAFFLALEELASAGAPGLALISVSDPLGAALAAGRDHPVYREYVESFLADTTGTHSGAWAISEPLVGADMVVSDAPFRATARQAPGGGWILDGAKSRWVGNGWLADMVIVMIHVADTGTGVFLVPMDWPGVVRGEPVEKVGLRALNQCSVAFEQCHVPAEFLVVPPSERYRRTLMKGFLAPGNLSIGFTALGVAQAAYELELAYADAREQGGGRISGHQLVAKRLFDAYASITAARWQLRRAAWLFGRGELHLPAIFAARVFACRVALQVTADAVYVHGANGVALDHGVQKLWRDAQPLQMADGPTDVICLEGARLLVDHHRSPESRR